MALQLSRFTESDISIFHNITHAAFKDEISVLMFPTNLNPESHAKLAARDLKALREDKQVHYLKITDTSSGEIIAAARWLILDPRRSKEDWEKEAREREMPTEGNIEVKKPFFGILTEQRIKWMSDKLMIFLHLLVTLPNHHRRGAGSMLLRWGCDQADKLGLESYVEASIMGKPLYERFGYETVDVAELDLRPYGGSEIDRHDIMLRKPRTISGTQ